MNIADTIHFLKEYASEWGISLPEPRKIESDRKWFRTIGHRVAYDSDTIIGYAYVERNGALPEAFHVVPRTPNTMMLPLWAAYPTVSAFDITWRMGGGEDYKYKWREWYDALSKAEQADYQSQFPAPDDDRGWALCFWDHLNSDD